jgi:antitoxin (DNA-binding transcriptional repressor) of toxin-antitoxin stability system
MNTGVNGCLDALTANVGLAQHALPEVALPWWATMALSLTAIVFSFLLGLIRRLVPHESNDRLQWWIALLAHRRQTISLLQRGLPTKGDPYDRAGPSDRARKRSVEDPPSDLSDADAMPRVDDTT